MEERLPTAELLKLKGLKATGQRIAIYEAMRSLGHASADEVKQEVGRAGGPATTTATVYNVLQDLTRAGLLQRRMSVNSKMYYDITVGNHCHIYDKDSHVITDFDDNGLVEVVNEYLRNKKINNFELDYVDIQLMGRFKKKK